MQPNKDTCIDQSGIQSNAKGKRLRCRNNSNEIMKNSDQYRHCIYFCVDYHQFFQQYDFNYRKVYSFTLDGIADFSFFQ